MFIADFVVPVYNIFQILEIYKYIKCNLNILMITRNRNKYTHNRL